MEEWKKERLDGRKERKKEGGKEGRKEGRNVCMYVHGLFCRDLCYAMLCYAMLSHPIFLSSTTALDFLAFSSRAFCDVKRVVREGK